MSGVSSEVRHVVAWLQPVRWLTCIALWTVLTVIWLLPQLDLSLREVGVFVSVAAICRTLVLVTSRWRTATTRMFMGLAFASDAVLLTGLLDITGGPFNPFIVMYGAYVWAAAAVLSTAWAGVVSATSLLGFGWLLLDHLRPGLTEHHRLNDFPAHLFAMWFAAAGLAELVAHYVARARVAFAQQQAHIDEARERASRSDRMASLMTLAAGAAHELSTPLATIAVAARELERNAALVREPLAVGSALKDDARLIRSELDRCQAILDGMSGRAGAASPATLAPLSPAEIVPLLRERLPDSQRARLDVDLAAGAPTPSAPGAALVQAISSLLKNAFEASASDDTVILRFGARNGMARIEVQDRGVGMPPDTHRRAGEPFFTTKEPGKGFGLGLFLVRAFAERSGGTLEFDVHRGTTAILEIPVSSDHTPSA